VAGAGIHGRAAAREEKDGTEVGEEVGAGLVDGEDDSAAFVGEAA
jgi:hypothetical protein